ncbi:pyridoxamine 5'-phosphate oxidase family protein [Deinococcus alpinitundrae]|uniref:pyridoxamine 5'-phosphate oxidase family protein n=1 Tax=Deinococcus alpinitundrae TaxID=468913 RepID=UPI00137AB08F|nr:pyridoxamine 5'-phosphate oxidase family protein [Deinococcus alpinitundrae]
MTTSQNDQGHNQPSREEGVQTIAKLIKGIKFAMMTFTTEAGHLHSQPMTTQEQEFDGDVWFIGSKESDLVHSLAKKAQVNLSYSESGKGYVSLYGDAELIEDAAKLDELWSDFYKAYFPQGKTDPNIQLIKVEAKGAHYWESDGKLQGLFQMAKAAVTGSQPNHGDSDSVKL